MPTVHRKASKSHIQTLLFPREFWTRAKSRKWAIEHDFHADGVEVTKKYIRLRQYDPQSRKFDYRFVRMTVSYTHLTLPTN